MGHPVILLFSHNLDLNCLPAAQTHTQEGASISGKAAKNTVLEAMKKQFYNDGQTINEDVLSTQGSTSACTSLVVTKDKYENVVQPLQLYPTTKKKDQFMKNCYKKALLGKQLEGQLLFRKVVAKSNNGSNNSPGGKLKKVNGMRSSLM